MRGLSCYAFTLLTALAAISLLCCAAPAGKPAPSGTENKTSPAPASKPWPRVNGFTASSDNVSPGENVTLKWDVSDARITSIDSGVGKVSAMGTAVVAPQRTTKYTLTATGEMGVSTAWVIVKVPEKTVLMPDLVITGVTYISGLLYYTVKNIGGVDAGQSDTYIYDQSNMLRDTSWVDGLKAGEEKTRPFTNFSYQVGKVTICADGGRVMAEASEDNNCFVLTYGFKYNYDFSQYASRAAWRGSAGQLEFGLISDAALGQVTRLNAAAAEDGKSYGAVIEMSPPPEAYGWMEGLFGDWQDSWQTGGYMMPLELPNNARFTARVGLSKEAEGGSGVTFIFGLMSASGLVNWWPGVKAGYDGKLDSLNIDLSSYAGKKVMALLRVEAGADPDKNYALWIEPKLSQ